MKRLLADETPRFAVKVRHSIFSETSLECQLTQLSFDHVTSINSITTQKDCRFVTYHVSGRTLLGVGEFLELLVLAPARLPDVRDPGSADVGPEVDLHADRRSPGHPQAVRQEERASEGHRTP